MSIRSQRIALLIVSVFLLGTNTSFGQCSGTRGGGGGGGGGGSSGIVQTDLTALVAGNPISSGMRFNAMNSNNPAMQAVMASQQQQMAMMYRQLMIQQNQIAALQQQLALARNAEMVARQQEMMSARNERLRQRDAQRAANLASSRSKKANIQ